jgi:N-acetylmuramoyl-L-alanine amidase
MSRIRIVSGFIFLTAVSILLSSCATHRVSKYPADGLIVEDIPYAGVRQGTYHTVAPGETLWRIAKMYEVDQEAMIKANRVKDVTDINVGTRLYIPQAAPRKHVITLYPSDKWKYIIVHHSATDVGSSEKFNAAHIKRGWQGIGYHFVIDNGTAGKDDGQIETGPRWIKQQDGAHCKASSMNKKAIGVCLVGNFSTGKVSKRQMESLVYLVNMLRKYYNIPKTRILGHGMVPGAKTECPGKKFPWDSFMAKLGR